MTSIKVVTEVNDFESIKYIKTQSIEPDVDDVLLLTSQWFYKAKDKYRKENVKI